MTQPVQGPREYDRAMVHHFIRLVGRAPTDEELVRFRDLHSRLASGQASRLRRRAARLFVRM